MTAAFYIDVELTAFSDPFEKGDRFFRLSDRFAVHRRDDVAGL
jgi:hypothetical protein